MFNFLKRKRRQRCLFEYFDGTRQRRADPLRIERALVSHPDFNASEHPAYANEGHEPEMSYMLDAICKAFEVQPFDDVKDSGLTDGELFDLWNGFWIYVAALQKKTAHGSILQPLTDLESSTGTVPQQKTESCLPPSTSPDTELKPSSPTVQCEASETECAPS